MNKSRKKQTHRVYSLSIELFIERSRFAFPSVEQLAWDLSASKQSSLTLGAGQNGSAYR